MISERTLMVQSETLAGLPGSFSTVEVVVGAAIYCPTSSCAEHEPAIKPVVEVGSHAMTPLQADNLVADLFGCPALHHRPSGNH